MPCDDDEGVDLEGVFIVTTGFYRGQLRGSYTGSNAEITIPKSVNDPDTKEAITVTSIWHDVFRNYSEDPGLSEVNFKVGDEFTRIHARAFMNNDINSVAFPESLKRIDLRAFRDNELTKVTIPQGVHTIEWQAFANNNITEVELGGGYTINGEEIKLIIGHEAFYFGGNDITEITIGDNVEIGDRAFGNNKPNEFRDLYKKEGAGTYEFDEAENKWEKKEEP